MAEPPWPFVRMGEVQSLVRVLRGPQLFLPFSQSKTRVRVICVYIRYFTPIDSPPFRKYLPWSLEDRNVCTKFVFPEG